MNVKTNTSEGRVIIAALMPHAPALVPAVSGQRGNRAGASVSAMTEAARRIVRAGPEMVVLISPHTPRRRMAFAVFGLAIRFAVRWPSLARRRRLWICPPPIPRGHPLRKKPDGGGLEVWWWRDAELDHGTVVPLWHLADAGWRGPTVVIWHQLSGRTGLGGIGRGHRQRGVARRPSRGRGGQR